MTSVGDLRYAFVRSGDCWLWRAARCIRKPRGWLTWLVVEPEREAREERVFTTHNDENWRPTRRDAMICALQQQAYRMMRPAVSVDATFEAPVEDLLQGHMAFRQMAEIVIEAMGGERQIQRQASVVIEVKDAVP